MFLLFEVIDKPIMIFVTYLLTDLALIETRIYSISSIVLILHLNILALVILKSLFTKFKAIIIVILS